MRKGGGKAKGAEFERECCRLLSLWVSGGKQEDCFWRSAMSGGRSTVAHKKGLKLTAQSGDISAISPLGEQLISQYFVECKFYRDLDFTGLLTGKGKFIEFWETAKREADKYNKHPILIAKQNRYPTYICLDRFGERMFFKGTDYIVYVVSHDLFVCDFKTFLEKGEPRYALRQK